MRPDYESGVGSSNLSGRANKIKDLAKSPGIKSLRKVSE
jgi:hypothetical protein